MGDIEYAGETSGTSLLAATTYRMAVVNPGIFSSRMYLDWAHLKRYAFMIRIDEDGFAKPAANPLDSKSKVPVDGSAEGESFLLLLGSASLNSKGYFTWSSRPHEDGTLAELHP